MDSELKEVLMPLTIIGTFGASVYFFVKVMTDYILKKKMIEKGFVNDDTQAIFKNHTSLDGRFGSLKWGLITLSAGLALIVISMIDIHGNSPLPYGLLMVFISIGFLAYYAIVRKSDK